jgi:IrrE N-terminal-like domain
MSEEDRRVVRRQDDEVRRLASQTKKDYGTLRRRPVNIVRCLESGTILTCRGRKKLIYRVVEDAAMGTVDGKTEFTSDSVIISVKRTVHHQAFCGDGRSRMTLAHELAHGVLHYGDALYRASAAAGVTSLSKLRPEDSAEHQAKVFASAFLVDDSVVEELSSPEDVSLEFLLSSEAAKICFDRVHREKHRREEGAEQVRKANERFQAAMRSQKHFLKYANRACPECGNVTLVPSGFGLLCHTCGFHETGE